MKDYNKWNLEKQIINHFTILILNLDRCFIHWKIKLEINYHKDRTICPISIIFYNNLNKMQRNINNSNNNYIHNKMKI